MDVIKKKQSRQFVLVVLLKTTHKLNRQFEWFCAMQCSKIVSRTVVMKLHTKKKPRQKQGFILYIKKWITVFHPHYFLKSLLHHKEHYSLFVEQECLVVKTLYAKPLKLQHQIFGLEFLWYFQFYIRA
jgi:hypothetical protein